ncbi:MAG: hypothetical protein U1F66_11680 [bacterium]
MPPRRSLNYWVLLVLALAAFAAWLTPGAARPAGPEETPAASSNR